MNIPLELAARAGRADSLVDRALASPSRLALAVACAISLSGCGDDDAPHMSIPEDASLPPPACDDDRFEDNDVISGAPVITLGEITSAVLCPAEDPQDFFAVELTGGVMYRLFVGGDQGTLGLDVLTASRDLIARNRGTQTPTIEVSIADTGMYTLQIDGCCASRIAYTIDIQAL